MDVRIVWLSHTPGEGSHDPTAIDALAMVIQEFVEEHKGEGVVLLDGLEYLIINNGFLQILKLVEHLNGFMMQRKATVLLPVSPDALEPKELLLLEGTVKVIGSPVSRTAVRLIPRRPDLHEECMLLRSRLPANSDVDDTPRALEERIREAQRDNVPFIVVVSGGEARSGILHVLHYSGKETWMRLDTLLRAITDWESSGG